MLRQTHDIPDNAKPKIDNKNKKRDMACEEIRPTPITIMEVTTEPPAQEKEFG